MRQRILQFTKRPFVRNVAMVASGTAVSQVIGMGFAPLITRLYGPEVYGIQGVFMSIAGVAGAIAALAYPVAIVLPESDADAAGLAWLSVAIGVVMSVLAVVVMFFFGSTILSLLNAEQISAFFYLIPVSMLITVVSTMAGQWAIRRKAFVLTAQVAVLQTLVVNVVKAGLGAVHPTAAVLIVTSTLSSLLSTVMLWLGLRKARLGDPVEAPSSAARPSLWRLAKQYRDFPLFRAPHALINTVSFSLPVMMLATFFGSAAVGFYSIACAVLAMPISLIGNSVMQVFYPRINQAIHRGEDARSLIVRATMGLALSGALPFLIVILTGPMLFGLVFGSEWERAGIYAQWLSIWLFFNYINKPAVSAIPALRLQRGLLIYELFSTGTKVLALYIGNAIFASDVVAIALFSAFGVVAYAWLILWVIFHSGRLAVTVQPLLSRF